MIQRKLATRVPFKLYAYVRTFIHRLYFIYSLNTPFCLEWGGEENSRASG